MRAPRLRNSTLAAMAGGSVELPLRPGAGLRGEGGGVAEGTGWGEAWGGTKCR